MSEIQCPVCQSEPIDTFLTCKDHTVSHESFDLLRCGACDFVWTKDVPDSKAIGKYYQSEDYIAHSDTRQGLVNRLFHVSRSIMLSQKRKLIHKQHHNTSGQLLDYGCGTGYFLSHMQSRGWDVTGIEPGEAARQFISDHFHLPVHSPDVLSQLPDHSMDVITLWHVLEHVHDPRGAISEFRRILSDDGCLLIALPNLESLDAKHYKSFWAAFDVPRHLWHFSPETFNRFIRQQGFEITKIARLPLDSFYVSLLSEKYSGHKLAFIRGMIIGALSWLNSLFSTISCSSVIYVLHKNGDHQ